MKRYPFFFLAFLFLPLVTPVWGASLSSADIELYRRCFAALDKGKWEEARKESQRAKNPLLAKVILWMDLTRPGPGRDFNDYRRFIQENPDWPKQDILWAQAERALPANLPSNEIIAWFGKREPSTAAGGAKLAAALAANGNDPATLVKDVWINKNFDRELETDFYTRWTKMIGPEDQWARMDRLLWDGELDQAKSQLSRITSRQRDIAVARIRLQRLQPDALAAYKAIAPDQRKDAGLILDLARYYRKRDEAEKAKELLDPPPTKVVRPDLLWEELERAVRLALDGNNPKQAYRLARGHGARDGLTFAEGEFLSGWIALRELHDPATAISHFGKLFVGTNSSLSKSRGAYWAGLAASEAGRGEEATKYFNLAGQFPLTFYGQLALVKLHRAQLALAKPIALTAAEIKRFNGKELTEVVRMLGTIKQKDLTKPFLQRLIETSSGPGEVDMIGALARSIGGDNLGIYAAKEARKSAIDVVEPLFPLIKVPPHGELEPAVTLGIIRQESAFDPQAKSQAGALGMMQLLPSTAKDIAKGLKLNFHSNKLTNEPSYNIRLGQHYISQLVGRFNGSYILAIAAYNAGPARVRQWIDTYGDPRSGSIDAIDWIERIPFPETRNYVQRVLENTQVYRARLQKGSAPLLLDKDLNRNEVANARQ